METGSGRSLAPIDIDDLLRLARLATEVEAGLFARRPQGAGRYAGRLICRALCQGAALHYLDGSTGSKTSTCSPSTQRTTMESFHLGGGKQLTSVPRSSGVTRAIRHRSKGRRVDFLGRSLDVPPDAEPVSVLRGYLSAARTDSARELAAKAVILISPEQVVGKVAWPHPGSSEDKGP